MECRSLARQVDLGRERGQTEAETTIDRVFGGPEIGNLIAATMAAVEQGSHHPAQKPPPPMCRQDARDSDPGRGHPAARDRQAKRKSAQAADSATVLPCGVYALRRQEADQSRRQLVIG
jgi:hypothetical protein